MIYNTLVFLVKIIFKVIFKIEVINEDALSTEGAYIYCANHIGLLDPIIISIVTDRQIYWMAKQELFSNIILGKFLKSLGAFPVDRENTSIKTLRHSKEVLNEGNILGIFPEGTRVKSMDLSNAKPGVILISDFSKAPILPIYIESTYKLFSKIKVVVGEELEVYNNDVRLSKNDYKKYGELVLKKIYSLK